jgi:hypothetical protein|nr:MAG TPA: hypothetical protein [Caudoviricetes sp.]
MKLIDADTLMQDIRNTITEQSSTIDWLNLINRQPTAYDPDKVVEQLENERKFWENAYDSNLGKEKARSYEHAIEIVKGGGVDG